MDGLWKIRAVNKNGLGYLEIYYIYDKMGRLIRTQVKEASDKIIMSDVKYDNAGRRYKDTKPMACTSGWSQYNGFIDYAIFGCDSSDPLFSVYWYDSLGRNAITMNFDSTNVSMRYGSGDLVWSKVKDEEDNVRTFYSDSRGNLVKVNENGIW